MRMMLLMEWRYEKDSLIWTNIDYQDKKYSSSRHQEIENGEEKKKKLCQKNQQVLFSLTYKKRLDDVVIPRNYSK